MLTHVRFAREKIFINNWTKLMPDAPDMRLGEVAEDGFVVTVRSIHSKIGCEIKITKTSLVTTGSQDICFKGSL